MIMEIVPSDILYTILDNITDYKTYSQAICVNVKWRKYLEKLECRNRVRGKIQVDTMDQVREYCKRFPNLRVYLSKPQFENIETILMYKRVFPNAILFNYIDNYEDTREMDIKYFSNVHTLIISKYPNTNLKALEHIHTIYIKNCDVEDVSALKNLHTISLNNCPKIKDVSALKNVRDLTLYACNGITDISMLTGVRKLWIENCHNISMWIGLENIPDLKIINCTSINLL